MLELSDKDFKAVSIKMLPRATPNPLDTPKKKKVSGQRSRRNNKASMKTSELKENSVDGLNTQREEPVSWKRNSRNYLV